MMDIKKVTAFNEVLRSKKLKIVCAESITAGLLASTIASVSGASDVLLGSIVTYNRDLKTAILGVPRGVIDLKTAESMITTVEMAHGLTRIYPKADLFVAVTGIASGSTATYTVKGKPGDIFVAIFYKGAMYEFPGKMKSGDRNAIREETVAFIFGKILEVVQG